MASAETPPIRLHEDAALFREAVTFTAVQTGFESRLIEKDYFCSVVLQHLATEAPDLVFKGGTCLAKIHTGFHRLSEDLDFTIPMPVDAGRAQRSRAAKPVGAALGRVASALGAIRVSAPLRGANNSAQYLAALTYVSMLDDHTEPIRIEIGLREPLLEDRVVGVAQTLLLDPISGGPLIPSFALACLSRHETMAEKLRAALARLEPAIRDFYDIDHVIRSGGLDLDDDRLLRLVMRKLATPDTGPVDVSETRLLRLRDQIASELQPVLRRTDLEGFDLDRAFAAATRVARVCRVAET